MFILSHIYPLFGAASISLHQCPLTIQEEAPPPQWLTPISCVWLGHWCRTKLWHCTSQSKLCSLSLLSLGPIHPLMFILNLFLWWLQQEESPLTPLPTINKSEWLSVFCSYDLKHGAWWIFLVIVFKGVTWARGQAKRRQVGLWPWELWVRKDGAQQERSILI